MDYARQAEVYTRFSNMQQNCNSELKIFFQNIHLQSRHSGHHTCAAVNVYISVSPGLQTVLYSELFSSETSCQRRLESIVWPVIEPID